jgi:hypothetical protein
MINLINNRNISYYLFGLFFIYQMIGVMIHKQYGFGFFYWPVQLYGMAIISFLVFLLNINSLMKIWKPLLLFNFYFFSILVFQLFYLFNDNLSLSYFSKEEVFNILIETVLWYIITLVMAFYYDKMINTLTINKMSIIYGIILILFFMYVIKLNQNFSSDISRAFWIGANFPTIYVMNLSESGYVRGFHLYFSPLFSIFSIVFIFILQKEKKIILSYSIFILSIYILFLASGRGSLITFIFINLIFLLNKKTLFYLLSISFFLYIIINSTDLLILLSERNQRLYDILTLNFSDDNSSIGRIKQFEYNVRFIYENWYTGGLRSYYAILGKGQYIHSVLSVLQEYGFIAFSALIFLFIHGLYLIIKIKNNYFIVLISKAIFLYILIEVFLFKYVSEIKILIPLIISYYYLIKTYKEGKNVI